MLPIKMTEASCAKCHKQQVYVPKADNLGSRLRDLRARRLLRLPQDQGLRAGDVKKPGPILTKIDSKLTPDWVKTWIRNPRAVKPATWMPRIWYNSNYSSPEDAVRNEVEINAVGGVSVRQRREARVRREEPAARRREERRADRQVDRLPGLPRRRRRARAPSGRAAPHLRPAAREHRQQDDLRVGVQLGARSEALQPGHLHAEPAAHRRAGGRRRDLPDDVEAGGRRRGRRRPGQGRRRRAARLLQGGDAVRGREGGARQARCASRSSSRSGSGSSAGTAASAATTSRASRRRSRSAPTCRKKGSKLVSRLDFAFITDIPHTSKIGVVPHEAARPAHLRQGTRAAAAGQAADAELRFQRRRESIAC